MRTFLVFYYIFFFNDTATTEIYTLSLHDALPISRRRLPSPRSGAPPATPGWWSARSGQAPRHRAVLVGSWRDRRAPPEEAAPRAGVARPAAGSGARRRVVDPPGSPPRGPRGGADDRE